MNFKVGDKVKRPLGDAGGGDIFTVKSIVGNKVWQDDGFYTDPERLILISNFKEVKMEDVKFGLKFELDEDPVEFFKTKKQAEKRIKELLKDRDVQRDKIYLFEVHNIFKVELPVAYELKKV